MITHHPVLSLTALLSLLGVTFFYLIVLCQKKGERKIIPNNSRTLAKKAALRKKKKEEAKKAAKKSKDGTTLRNRQGRRDDTGIDSEELSQSDVRTGTGTGSETGTQSEGEPDSQVELSSGEETKKRQMTLHSFLLAAISKIFIIIHGIYEMNSSDIANINNYLLK